MRWKKEIEYWSSRCYPNIVTRDDIGKARRIAIGILGSHSTLYMGLVQLVNEHWRSRAGIGRYTPSVHWPSCYWNSGFCAYSHTFHPLFIFFPTFLLTLATIIINSSIYSEPHAGPWLIKAIEILFWIYCGITICSAVLQYYLLFTGTAFTLQSMTPAWLLPILPATLVGTMAGTISPSQPPGSALSIIVGGLLYQGLAWLGFVFMLSIYMSRLTGHGLPTPNTRPGMFVAVGPPCECAQVENIAEVLTHCLAFTVVALINLADSADIKIPNDYFTDTHLLAGIVLKLVAGCTGLFIWLMAFWFFAISLIATVRGVRKMSFHLTWWAVVFPNVAFTLATVKLGDVLHSPAISWVTTAMTILLAIAWIFVAAAHIEAVWSGKILWPGKDEDRHGSGQLTCAVSDCPQCLASKLRQL